MKIVVLSPHRDDAAFSLALAIGAWINGGHDVLLLNCFTRSEYAPFTDVASSHPNDRMSYVTALRLREDKNWCRKIGITSRLDLDLKDAPIRLRCTLDDVCSVPIKENDKAVRKISTYLQQMTPEALVLPLAIGGHVDHRTALAAALPESLGLPCAFYEDLPYAARPEAEGSVEGIAFNLSEALKPSFAELPRDPEAAARFKRGHLLCYDSQIDDAVVDQIANFSGRYEGRERLWGNAAWLASALSVRGD